MAGVVVSCCSVWYVPSRNLHTALRVDSEMLFDFLRFGGAIGTKGWPGDIDDMAGISEWSPEYYTVVALTHSIFGGPGPLSDRSTNSMSSVE